MPLNRGGKPGEKKEDDGILGGLSRAASFINPLDIATKVATNDPNARLADKLLTTDNAVAKNVGSALDFVRPDKLLPAVAGAGIQQAKALPTSLMAAHLAATGGMNEANLKSIDETPVIGGLIDTGNLRKQQELFNRNEGVTGLADKFNAVLGTASPVAQGAQLGFAETGIRAGAAPVASAVSQTGLFGPRITPNQAAELANVESYGQAAQEGRAGAVLLGDILNIAPALKGAGAATALNPLAETAAGARISQAGAALERAPLAPYSAPAKKIYGAIETAQAGGTAFPRLAELAQKEIPVVSKAAALPEAVAKHTGGTWAGAEARLKGITEQAKVNREFRPELDAYEASLRETADRLETNSSEYQTLAKEYTDFQDSLRAQALDEAQYQIVRRAAQRAEKLGLPAESLVSTDAMGRRVGEVAAPGVELIEPSYTSPGGRQLLPGGTVVAPNETIGEIVSPERAFNPEAAPGRFAEPTPVLGQGGLFDQTINPEVAQTGAIEAPLSSSQMGFEGIDRPFKEGPAKMGNVETPAGFDPRLAKINDEIPHEAVRQVPEHFTDDYIKRYFKGLDTPAPPPGEIAGKAVKAWDQMMSTWKTGVLPVRPAWHTTNIVGNAMGAMLLGEVSPAWFAQNIGRIMDEVRGKTDEGIGAARGRGLTNEVIRELEEGALPGQKVGKFNGAVRKSYEFNEKVDDFTHTAVALQELDRQLAAGIPREAAIDAAVSKSLKSVGDFGNMSSVERAYIRRVMPFYPWYKHTAKATLRFPMENPGRFLQSQAWANRLTPGQETPEGGEFLRGSIPMAGGRFLRIGGGLGIGSPEDNPLLDPTSVGADLAPPIQGLAALGGLNLQKGRAIEAAPGQSRLSATAGYLTNTTPLTKMAADLADYARGEGGVLRGDTRGIITKDGRPMATSTEGTPLLSFLTGVGVQKPDLEELKKKARKTEKSEEKKVKNYETAIKKKAK